MADKTLGKDREKQLTREELDSLLEELGLSTDTAKNEYQSMVESFNKLTLWQDQQKTQIARLSGT